ncbi:MAG: efflux RND transporter periplasmic adaptor subunit [Bacteroidales bacterium]|nr:efflux RND transporter periplasmic adaptor subunit [Bacteroidales bacterium]
MLNKKVFRIVIPVIILMAGCGDKNQETPSEGAAGEALGITLTDAQIEVSKIETGTISRILLHDKVECNGTIEACAENQAIVAPIMKGYLKNLHVHMGEYVRKGDVLATLSHPDYIRIQEEYLETKSQYEYFKEDFKRQGELSIDQATSIKKMQEAQNEYRKTEARLFALKHQLQFLGLDPENVHVESMIPEIELKSPINGYISAINATIGMLCREESTIFKIIGDGLPILHLKVFETDANKIAPGQSINFVLLNDPDKTYTALLKSSTHNLDENNIVNIHASLTDKDQNFIPGMFVKAEILVKSDSVYALPAQGVHIENNTGFIYEQVADNQFKSLEVKIGRTENEWVEIKSLPEGALKANYVVRGAYEMHAAFAR